MRRGTELAGEAAGEARPEVVVETATNVVPLWARLTTGPAIVLYIALAKLAVHPTICGIRGCRHGASRRMDRPRTRRKEICPGTRCIGRARCRGLPRDEPLHLDERFRTAGLGGMHAGPDPDHQDGQPEIMAVVRRHCGRSP